MVGIVPKPFVAVQVKGRQHQLRAAGRLAAAGRFLDGLRRFAELGIILYALVALASSYSEGDPRNPGDGAEFYPLSSRDAAEKLAQQLKVAVDEGATLHVGGEVTGKGAYITPAVITGIPAGTDSYYEEFFGPVAEVYKVSSEDEAIELANDSRYGLGGAVMSEDEERAKRVASKIDTGMIHVNIPQARGAELPFGGVKASGLGRELGPLGMDEFVNKQRFYVAGSDSQV